MNAAIEILRKYIGGDPDALNRELISAIAVLRDWPRWENLIEVARKVDRGKLAEARARLLAAIRYAREERRTENLYGQRDQTWPATEEVKDLEALAIFTALLAAIPEEK